MSRLRELRMQGFKSFVEPTRFVFEPGVTAVIGPNGSGKSNMADAIRWVLGEQSNRALRTRRADDVIFAGSESRRRVGMAEVSLTLDNHDGWLPIAYAEVMVTRRAYRSGDPEYLVNGTKVRLRDVVDLLGSGRMGANDLVVVGQGTVDAALSLRPEDRRQLFEEAAGVKALQVRRNEALAKLSRALDNLARVSDLVRELRPQVRRLALQAEHQEAHDRLGARVQALVLEDHARRERALQGALGEARRRAAAARDEVAAEREAQAGGQRAVGEAEERYWAREEEARAAVSAWEAAREAVIRADGRHQALEDRGRELERVRRELDAAQAALAAEADDPATGTEHGSDRASPGSAVAMAEATWRDAAARGREADEALLAAEAALAAFRRDQADRLAADGRQAADVALARARAEALDQELSSVEAALAPAEAALTTAADRHTQAQTDLDRAATRAVEADEAAAAARAAVTDAEVALAELEGRQARATTELAALDGSPDGAPELAERLRAAGWTATPASWREGPAAAAALALLGDLGRVLLWREGAEAEVVVRDVGGEVRLLRPGHGPVTGRAGALAAVGASQTLAEALGEPGGPELLHRTVVAPDLSALLAGWARLPVGWVAVTLVGDVADARGVLTLRGRAGGALGAVRDPVVRRAELEGVRDRLAAEVSRATAKRRRTVRDVDAAAAAADAASTALEAARIGARSTASDLAATESTLERLRQHHAALLTDLDGLREALSAESVPASVDTDQRRLEEVATAARVRRDAATADQEAARQAWEAAARAADVRDAAAVDRRAALARLEERRTQLDAQRARVDEEERAQRGAVEAAAEALAAARQAEDAAAAARRRADEARTSERQALLDAERRLSGGTGRLIELERREQAGAAELSRLEEALAAVDRERSMSLEGLPEPGPAHTGEPAAAEALALSDEDLAEELRRARRTLLQIGSVNPFAIDEHHELSARLEDLASQEADLRAASEATQTLIERLDAEISQQFQAAFAAIGQRFDEYCRLLFAGGSASLELTSGEDREAPGGIEIAVRPPGKRLQRLAMLSGGERALTGVALLFAMLSVNPVPFCVLDEVDAALDEANIGRFVDALRDLAQTMDFVVITHNRATIETADAIYGVTMTDAAVSRVLSLRLADVPVEVSA